MNDTNTSSFVTTYESKAVSVQGSINNSKGNDKIAISSSIPATSNPIETKYALYDQNYRGKDAELAEFIIKETAPQDIEKILLKIGYYGVWFGSDNDNLSAPLEISSTLRNGKAYGIKLMHELEGYNILYYYLDDPNTIYSDSLYYSYSGPDMSILDTSENGMHTNLTPEQYQYVQSYSEDDSYYEESNSYYQDTDDEYSNSEDTGDESNSSLTEADIYFEGAQFLDKAISESSKLQKYVGYSYQIIGKKNAKEGLFGNTTLSASFGIKFADVFQEYTVTITMTYNQYTHKLKYSHCSVSSGYNDYTY